MNPLPSYNPSSLGEWISTSLQNDILNNTIKLISSPGDLRVDSTISLDLHPRSERPRLDKDKLRKLIDGALYNEWFVGTYLWVILGIVMCFSGRYWMGRAKRSGRWRRWRGRGRYSTGFLEDQDGCNGGFKTTGEEVMDHDDVGSSGSSALGSSTPTIKLDDENEHTSLLSHQRSRDISSPHITLSSRLRAFLIYQPQSVPYINKALPQNQTTLSILSLLLLNFFYTFYHIAFDSFSASILGDRASLIFATNLPLLYILSAKTQPLNLLTGTSYESLNILHRRLGGLLIFEALLHGICMFIMWYSLLKPYSGWSLWDFLSNQCIYLGIMALLTYKCLYTTSLASFRQRWYELFLGTHVVLQAAALLILYFHHRGSRKYVGWALSIFVVDRLVYRLCVKSTWAEATTHIYPDNTTLLLTFDLPQTPSTLFSRTFGRSLTTGWQAADHLFLTIPSLGRSHALQAHPFTIFSRPPNPESNSCSSSSSLPSPHTAPLTLLIRAHSGFTRTLLQTALTKNNSTKTLNCRLDGPYGSPHARPLLSASDLAIIIAGGSGIAVVLPLIHHLLHNERSGPCPREHDPEMASPNPIPETECMDRITRRKNERKQKIILLWITQNPLHKTWLSSEEKQELENQGVKIVIPEATSESGRMDVKVWIRGVVEGEDEARDENARNGVDGYERGHRSQRVGSRRPRNREAGNNGCRGMKTTRGREEKPKTTILVSGPDSLNRCVNNGCADLVREGRDIDVLVEKFGW